MLSRVPPVDHQSTKIRVQCAECLVAVTYNGKDPYCRHSASVSSILSSPAGSNTGNADPVVIGRASEAQGISRTGRELPILRSQYVARGVCVLFGSRLRLNRFQERTIVLRTGAKPTLAVYAENRTAAPFNASEVQAETTYTLLLSTICDLIGSAGSNRGNSIELSSPRTSAGLPDFRLRIRFATTADANIWCSTIRESLDHANWSRDVRPEKLEINRSQRQNVRIVQHVHSSERFVVKVLATNNDERACHELQILHHLYNSCAARDLSLMAGSRVVETAEEIVLVMPQLPGITLLQFLRQSRRDNGRRLSEEEGWRLLARLAEILQTVHQSGIVHCDLNLENVMVSLDLSRVWLIDFGAAYNLLDVQHNQQMTGTPGFVAPERVLDPLVPPTPKTDVFSLGIVLFQALTGKHPYTTATREKRPLLLLDSLCLDWSQAEIVMKESTISPQLCDIVGEMLKADPQARISMGCVHAVKCRYL
ncbi:Protein kinase domain [Phytophthora infestans]|uniref:Protein kinase domain n=1 Tax=Phytophthora infestans TaxID=4787 RepID=A0A833VZC2_PHYIN|nr:Protein kinase domain [Phytophthora infestans]